MEQIRVYLLRLAAAAVLCTITKIVSGNSGLSGTVVKLLTAVIMVVTVAAPLVQQQPSDLTDRFPVVEQEVEDAVSGGKGAAYEAMAASIKTQTEAYILDKAETFGASLTVEVSVEGSDLPVPCGVHIAGSISPYGKKQLSDMIVKDLGIPAEEQIWIS